MPSWERKAHQRKTFYACAIISLVLLVGLLFFVTYLTLSWQDIVAEDPVEDLTFDLNDDVYDECSSRAVAVNVKAVMQTWGNRTNFSQAWSDAEQKAAEPAHAYMEKHHSTGIYMYTDTMLQPLESDRDTTERAGKQLKETFESRSLYSSLTEAIQILKHSQLTCLTTNYKTETLLNLNTSDKLVRFGTFVLGSDGWNLTSNASCFEIHTCFGADVTYYSALKASSQVLIPPYEVFKVTDAETNAQRCKVIYRLKSNLNCVYDKESNMLHPISALPVDGFWLIFAIMCVTIASLLLLFIIVKALRNHKKTPVNGASPPRSGSYSPASITV